MIYAPGTRFMFSRPRQRLYVQISSSYWFIVLLPLLWLAKCNNFGLHFMANLSKALYWQTHILFITHMLVGEKIKRADSGGIGALSISSVEAALALSLLSEKTNKQVQHKRTWLIIAAMHTTEAVVKLKPQKNSGLNGIRTHDLCDTGAVLHQLSYQAMWELVTLWVRNILVDDEEHKWIYEGSYIWTAEKDIKYISLRIFISILHHLRVNLTVDGRLVMFRLFRRLGLDVIVWRCLQR